MIFYQIFNHLNRHHLFWMYKYLRAVYQSIYCFRKVLLPTPPKMSKEERRQIFEAQVKAQEEMAEIERQQREAYLQQFYADPNNYMYYGQDPNCPVPPGFQPQLG